MDKYIRLNLLSLSLSLTVTSHARLTRNTGRDKNNLRALKSITQTSFRGVVAIYSALGVDMAQISSDTYKKAGRKKRPLAIVTPLIVINYLKILAISYRLANLPGPPLIS